MIIDTTSYELSESNFTPQGTKKERIVIGNSFTSGMEHITGWKNRLGGAYKTTAMFSIDVDGKIYQHFTPNYYSNFTDDTTINETSISIVLVNEGWLTKHLKSENGFINYVGHIYKRSQPVVEKRWRNLVYWAPYTNEQMDSASMLVKQLCLEFDIPLKVVSHNTSFDMAERYGGVLYRSNFEKYYTDVNPSWDCLQFKNKIEIN